MIPPSRLAGIIALGGTPVAPGASIASFTLTSSLSGVFPFTIAHVFRKGDVGIGQTVTTTDATIQVIPKNNWPDGTLKIAIISGVVTLVSGVTKTINLATGTSSGGTSLTLDNLKTALTAPLSFDCGSFGTASWTGVDFDAPFMTWVTGSQMSSWIYRKPVGTDTTLVAWMEVRVYSTGDVEVLPWIENGYLKVAGITNKSATYAFSMEGTQRVSVAIDLKHHQRTPLINGSAVSYWSGTDPLITPRHDTAYMQASELVPSYTGVVPPSTSIITGTYLPTSYTPLQQGSFTYDSDSMASSGFQYPIGLLPSHDVFYLTCTASKIYSSVIRNGFSAGRYGIHYRDEATNRPLKFSTYPYLNTPDGQGIKDNGSSSHSDYTVAATGGNGPTWDYAHHPSVGYMAYLLSGYFYFVEEAQFAAVTNYLTQADWTRGGGDSSTWGYNPRPGYSGSSALCVPVPGATQTRSAAWSFRTLAQALCITPDTGDTLRNEFVTAVEENCRFFSQVYLEQFHNPYGIVIPAEFYDHPEQIAIWQQDFFTAAWGYALAMDLPVSSTAKQKMNSFFFWKAKSVVMRLGKSTDWWYVNANVYNSVIVDTSSYSGWGTYYPTGTGPWLPNDAACYAATYAPGYAIPQSGTEGVIGLEYSDPRATAQGQFGNMQPAIAYAVRFGVSGALAGYNRMISASNYSTIASYYNSDRPVWGVKPKVITSSATTLVLGGVTGGVAGTGYTVTVGTDLPRTEACDVTLSVVGCAVSPSSATLAIGTGVASFTVTPSGADGSRAITTINTGRLNNTTGSFTVGEVLPAWLSGKSINQWFAIAGTSGAGGISAIDAWGGMAINPSTSELYIAAAGGHSDGADNRVVSLNLSADSPSWTTRKASTWNGTDVNVLYYSDGTPAARHLYSHIHYVASINAVLLGGCRYAFGGSTPTGPGMDLFDLATNDWLPRYTWPDITPFNGYVAAQDTSGNFWTASSNKFTISTKTWSTPGSGPGLSRFPAALDTLRNRIFGLQVGDGQGYDLVLGAVANRLDPTTGNSVPITFNASSALTELIAAAPAYAGMDYDSVNDVFLFYHGGETGKVYSIKPNSGTVWDISVLTVSGTPGAAPASGSGVNKRFIYVPGLKGFVLLPKGSETLCFLKTS